MPSNFENTKRFARTSSPYNKLPFPLWKGDKLHLEKPDQTSKSNTATWKRHSRKLIETQCEERLMSFFFFFLPRRKWLLFALVRRFTLTIETWNVSFRFISATWKTPRSHEIPINASVNFCIINWREKFKSGEGTS